MKRLLTILLLHLFIYIGAPAQNPMLRNYRATEYGAGTQNWCIDKTADNRLLLANNFGLLEFDSHWWRTFPLSNYSNVRSILFDEERGVVWAGGSEEFGSFRQDADNYTIQYRSLSDQLRETDHGFGEIWNIVKHASSVVFQGKNRLFFLGADSTLSAVSTPFTIESSGVAQGRLFVAGRQGVFSVEGGKVKPLPGAEGLQGLTVKVIMAYKQDIVFATTTRGLFLYHDGQLRPFLTELTPFIAKNQLFCADIQDDMLAIGTVRNGLLLHNIATGQTQYANHDTGLQNNTVLSLRFDEQQNVWLGLDQGISYVMPSFPSCYLLGYDSPIGTGYASYIGTDKLYLGTNQGLFTIPYPLHSQPTPPTPQLVGNLTGQIWQLRNIGGTLFCGSDAGAYTVNGTQATQVEGPEGTLSFMPLSQHPGLVLACDYRGLYLLKKTAKGYQYDGRLQGFSESSGNFEEDGHGHIWLSQWQQGVYRLTLSADAHRVVKTEHFNHENGLLVDEGNLVCRIGDSIYVSSVDGFFSYNEKTHQLEHSSQMNQIFNTYGVALRIYETPDHALWAYKPGYLAIARMEDGHYTVDSTSYKNVEREVQMGLGHPSFSQHEQSIFNGINGFFLVDNVYKAATQPSHIVFQAITGTNHGDSILYACNPHPQAVKYQIPHSENSIRFGFVMPEYVRPREIEYSCFLEGYDRQWSSMQTANEKEYTKLPRGNYTFRVRAHNKITGHSDEQAISIYVQPAWYETWVARVFYVIIIVALLWALSRWVRRRQDARMKLLEEQKEREMRQQQLQFDIEQRQKEHELTKLRNEQLETELKHRQSELADSTMNLMRKNDMLQTIDAQMSELSESVRREDPKAAIIKKIRDIRHDIQYNINDDGNWDKFEENFNLVYDNFMKRLLARFPDLKMNDRKLCAYLRMGLSSKEMASLFNTSVRSIETARYRLRKKLGMEQGDNLAEFIQTFEQ